MAYFFFCLAKYQYPDSQINTEGIKNISISVLYNFLYLRNLNFPDSKESFNYREVIEALKNKMTSHYSSFSPYEKDDEFWISFISLMEKYINNIRSNPFINDLFSFSTLILQPPIISKTKSSHRRIEVLKNYMYYEMVSLSNFFHYVFFSAESGYKKKEKEINLINKNTEKTKKGTHCHILTNEKEGKIIKFVIEDRKSLSKEEENERIQNLFKIKF